MIKTTSKLTFILARFFPDNTWLLLDLIKVQFKIFKMMLYCILNR